MDDLSLRAEAEAFLDNLWDKDSVEHEIEALVAFIKAHQAAEVRTTIRHFVGISESERSKSPDERIGDGSIDTLKIVIDWLDQRLKEFQNESDGSQK